MDPAIPGLLIIIALLIFLSAVFSASETAFSSLNRIRVKNKANEGSKKAIRTMKLIDHYDKLLTTILIANNIVNILSASLCTVLFTKLIANEQLAVTLSTIILTIVLLIFGEISPKSIAKEVPESFAMFISPVVKCLVILFTPFNWIFTQWKKLLLLIFKPKNSIGISEEELITIVDEATNDGGLNQDEGELIRSAIEFNDLTVRDIYTPRVDIDAAPISAAKDDLRELFNSTGFSRIPIYDDDIDSIIGVLHEKDFYKAYFSTNFNLRELMSPVICVTLTNNISQVLKILQRAKLHMAVVIDEYGGTSGIVTLEDIIEELVGEIWDEHDEVSEDIETIDNGIYIVKGSCDIEDMYDFFHIKYDDDEIEVDTVSGWIIDKSGKLPEIGEKFIFDNIFSVEVRDVDFRRVESVIVSIVDTNAVANVSESTASDTTNGIDVANNDRNDADTSDIKDKN